MTVTTSIREQIHTGNSIATNWPLAAKVLDASHVEVFLYEIAADLLTGPLADSLYRVNDVGNPGGVNIDYPLVGDPLANTHKLYVRRTVPYTQELVLKNQGGFYPKTIENQLDLMEMQIQQASGSSAILDNLSTLNTVPSLASLKQLIPGAFDNIFLLGRTTISDGGAGMFVWTAGDQSTPVLNDPQQGVWVPPDGDLTGASGSWKRSVDSTLTPMMFGAVGGYDFVNATGSDDTVALNAAKDYCALTGSVLYFTDYHLCTGTFEINASLKINGLGKDVCGIYCDIDRENEGVHVNASNTSIENIEIAAHIPDTIQNGQGTYGTCLTIGTLFYPAVFDPGLVEPDKLRNIIVDEVLLTRANGSASAHAVAITGRASSVTMSNLDIIGYDPTSRHGDAFLLHWGTTGLDFPLDGAGLVITPLVLQKEADAGTYHPNNIHISDVYVRNTGRFCAASSVYNVLIERWDFDGLPDTVDGNGVQLIDLVVGDEADRYAHADDAGKVYTNIAFRDGNAYNITGSGVNALSLIDFSGFGTSKYEDDPLTSSRYIEQPKWENIEFSNLNLEADLSDTTELINLRNLWAKVLFKNVVARGKVSQTGIKLQQINGQIIFDNCYCNLPVLIDDCNGITMRDTVFEGEQFPCFLVEVADTTGYLLGELVNDDVTGSNQGYVKEIVNGTDLYVQCVENWTPYNTAENLDGATSATSSAISTIVTQSDVTVEILGGTDTSDLTATLTAKDNTITVDGFAKDLKIGDKLTYSGGNIVYVTRYAEAGALVIEVTTAPAGAAITTTVTVERRTQNVLFQNCELSGRSRVVDATDCYNVNFTGGSISKFGQYGLLVDTNATVQMDGTEFQGGGLRRLISHDAALSTRDVVISPNATFNGIRLRFDESLHILHHLANNASAIAGSARDCAHIGTPITAEFTIGGTQFQKDNCRDITGTLV